VAQQALKIEMNAIPGCPYQEVLSQTELLEMLGNERKIQRGPVEIPVEDGRVFSALASEIPGDGVAITLHDITNLKKLDRIKSDFVNIVSHDLRSPLTAILGYVELIERVGNVNEAQRDFIRHVQTSVQNITSLINDLLNLGRIEAGFDVRNEAVDIVQIVQFAIESFRQIAGEKQVDLALDLPGSLPPILANPVQIRQMVDNLLDNAIKYTGSGGTITVQSTVAQDQIVLQFKDTGIGIPALDLPHVFDKFYRASNTGDESAGTGLGLSIVKSVVEAHGGRIWVDSVVGKGSSFTVVLPVAWETN
jgi:two-component system NtrC family sensor kinase